MSLQIFGTNGEEGDKKDDARTKKRKARSMYESVSAGLWFPVDRVHRHLKRGYNARRIRTDASVYLSTALQYLCAEILELAGATAKYNKRVRITPRHLKWAIRNDDELNILLGNVTLCGIYMMPRINSELKPEQSAGSSRPRARKCGDKPRQTVAKPRRQPTNLCH